MPDETSSSRVGRHVWYIIAVLALANVLSSVDRFLLNLLVEPIKADLSISDTQIATLQGVAFVLFYATLGLPIGRLVDNTSRRSILAAGIAVWSVMTAMCGLARGYLGLFLCRVGVGAGEATLYPSCYSMIPDLIPRHMIARATSIFVMGSFIGAGLALIAGGTVIGLIGKAGVLHLPFLGDTAAWRVTFLLVAVPGLLVSLLIMLTVREPARRAAQDGETVASKATLTEVFRFILANRRVLLGIFAGFSALTLFGYGMQAWTPTFLIRTYGWSTSQVGLIYGTIMLVFGPAGALAAGACADFLAARGYKDASLRTALIGCICMIPFAVAAPLAPTPAIALCLLAPLSFFASSPYPLAGTAIQMIAPNRMRGQLTAMFLFVINLVGLGFGPLLIGVLTDYVFANERQLHYSLVGVAIATLPLAAALLATTLRPLRTFFTTMSASGTPTPLTT